MFPESDTGVYVTSGVFALVVFAVAVTVAVGWTVLDLTAGTLLTLSLGFLLFIGVYFVSLVVYREIDRRERAE
ncbi:hypothetical protein KM295_10440 [Natronomonas sp. F2-12]|uniref:Uncharacterized protein n=2 Tax=Natronomonas aquatica TaxID=2841590 RepID=A0A9R1D715_9EURY|nr:hypothetical protein [Natronomonas aquatica]